MSWTIDVLEQAKGSLKRYAKMNMKTENTKRYGSVDDMLRGIGMDSDFVEDFNRQVESEKLSAQLQQLRVQAGLTQRELGERLGITQGAVSKIEHKADDDLTLKEIGSFLAATSSSMHLRMGSPQPKAEQTRVKDLRYDAAKEPVGA